MDLDGLISFLNKKGFYQTFEVLSKFKGNRAELHTFYENYTKLSYYNSFYRIKDILLEKNLINITKYKGKTYIILTKTGKALYQQLIELNNLINH